MSVDWYDSSLSSVPLSLDQDEALALIEDELRSRLAKLGDRDSGLHGFYRDKLRDNDLLSNYDRAVLSFLSLYRDRWQRVWEIGAGVGQLSALAAIMAFPVVSIEQDSSRFNAINAVADRLASRFPDAVARWERRNQFFPVGMADDTSHDLAVAMCATFSVTPELDRDYRNALTRFGAALIDFGTLFTPASAENEDFERARAFATEMGRNVRPIFRWSREPRTVFLVG